MTPARAEIVLADGRVDALLRRAAALARSEKGKAGDGARQGVDWSAAPWASDGLPALQDAARRREERRRQREARREESKGQEAPALLAVAAAAAETAEGGGGDGTPPTALPRPPPPACGETALDRAVRLLAASAGRPGSLGPAQILAMGSGKDKTAAGGDESASTQRRLHRRRAVAAFRAVRAQEFVEHAEADLAARAARQAAEEAALAERLRGRVVDAGKLCAFFSRLSSDAAKRSAQLETRRAEHAEREMQAVRASAAAARQGGAGGGRRPGTAPAAGRQW